LAQEIQAKLVTLKEEEERISQDWGSGAWWMAMVVKNKGWKLHHLQVEDVWRFLTIF